MLHKNEIKIYMLPVEEGDCLFVEICDENHNEFIVMIDSGTPHAWKKSVKPFLKNLKDKKKRVNLLIITHIDSDHIGGALKLYNEEDLYEIVDSIWYNGLNYILPANNNYVDVKRCDKVCSTLCDSCSFNSEESENNISAKQAHMLTELLNRHSIKTNHEYNYPICSNLPSLEILPNIYIDILLPTNQALQRLYTKFKKEVNSISMGTEIALSKDSEKAFELTTLCSPEVIYTIENISNNKLNISDIDFWAKQEAIGDKSVINASSIAICIRAFGKVMLFTGDATSQDLILALKEWQGKTNLPMLFDVIKLPHHGSLNNCLELLDYIDGEYYLISTDGSKFNHPSKETLAKIITRKSNYKAKRKLMFNYNNEMYKLFSNEECKKKYNYEICIANDAVCLL